LLLLGAAREEEDRREVDDSTLMLCPWKADASCKLLDALWLLTEELRPRRGVVVAVDAVAAVAAIAAIAGAMNWWGMATAAAAMEWGICE
jgi:hypothetical protein